MGLTTDLILHPYELRALFQWSLLHIPKHERDYFGESLNLKQCYFYLDQTSRSFSAVIQEVNGELREPIMIFYLILRALDTIEDDMTIPTEEKVQYLLEFPEKITVEDWTFSKCGPNEKDRQLLEDFKVVIKEFLMVKEEYQTIIMDKTKEMAKGMAKYCSDKEHLAGIKTIDQYDEYCHYVAGVVGYGLTDLYVEAGFANPSLKDNYKLANSMGLFLQKTNIIRDIREDWDDGRQFWPREIWSNYVHEFKDLFLPESKDIALNCLSNMVLNALGHIEDCFIYMTCLKEQSVFNFSCIPQVMAIATLSLVFRNPDVFQRNVKIRKGEACWCMQRVGSIASTTEVFRYYVRQLHAKNYPLDPNFLKISVACAKIEQLIDRIQKVLEENKKIEESPGWFS